MLVGGAGGDTAAGGANGGSVTVAGATAEVGTDGSGGGVFINGGGGDGTGVPGQITLGSAASGDTINFDSPAMKMGVALGLVGPTVVLFGPLGLTAFPAVPRIIQVTMAAAGAIAAGCSAYVDTSGPITGSAIPIAFTVPPGIPVDVHIVMYL